MIPNHYVQATPDYASVLIPAQLCGASLSVTLTHST